MTAQALRRSRTTRPSRLTTSTSADCSGTTPGRRRSGVWARNRLFGRGVRVRTQAADRNILSRCTPRSLATRLRANHGASFGRSIPGDSGHGGIGFIGALYERANEIKTISTRHETVSSFMADAYYRVSGQPTATFTSCVLAQPICWSAISRAAPPCSNRLVSVQRTALSCERPLRSHLDLLAQEWTNPVEDRTHEYTTAVHTDWRITASRVRLALST